MIRYTNLKDKVSIDIKEKYSVDLYIGNQYTYKGELRRMIDNNELKTRENRSPNRVFKVNKTNEKDLVKAINKEIEGWINKDFLRVPKEEVATAYVYYCDDLQYVLKIDNFLDDKNKKATLYDAKSYLKSVGETDEEIDEDEKRLAIYGARSSMSGVKFLNPLFSIGWFALLAILIPRFLRETGDLKYPSFSVIVNLFDKLIDKANTPLIFADYLSLSLVWDAFTLSVPTILLKEFADSQLNGRRSIKYYKEKLEKLETDQEKAKLLKKDFKTYLAGEKRFDNE